MIITPYYTQEQIEEQVLKQFKNQLELTHNAIQLVAGHAVRKNDWIEYEISITGLHGNYVNVEEDITPPDIVSQNEKRIYFNSYITQRFPELLESEKILSAKQILMVLLKEDAIGLKGKIKIFTVGDKLITQFEKC